MLCWRILCVIFLHSSEFMQKFYDICWGRMQVCINMCKTSETIETCEHSFYLSLATLFFPAGILFPQGMPEGML